MKDDIKLPPLPKGDIDADTYPVMWVHTDQQMENYAREAIKADRQQRRGEPVDKGPWKAGVNRSDKRTFIESDDFTHDVRLYVDGDFADQDEKLAYALGIADQLNAAPQPAKPVRVPSDEDIERLASEHLNAHAQFVGAGEVHYEGEIEFARALLARYGHPAEPEGWQLVPKEPGWDMEMAGIKELIQCTDG